VVFNRTPNSIIQVDFNLWCKHTNICWSIVRTQ